MKINVPQEISGLDTAWFRKAMALAHPGVEIDATHVVEVIPGTCTKIRVMIDYVPGCDAGLPRRMMVKGGYADHSPQFLEMHQTEMRYYRDIAPKAAFDTPSCYIACEDPEDGRAIVLLEDLSTRPVRWLSALEPLGWRDEAAFIDALAAFAAQHWHSAELGPGGRLAWVIDSYSAEAAVYIDHYLESDRWDQFLRLPRCACLPRSLCDRGRMRAMLDRLAERLDVQPMTLSHGDTHLGNLYLNPDGTPGFLDAQPRRAPYIKDFAYHMVAALDIEDRRNWERPLLSRYLHKLAEHGVAAVPSFEEAWYDYRCEIGYGLFIFMINESEFQAEEVNTAYTARFGAAAIDHATFLI